MRIHWLALTMFGKREEFDAFYKFYLKGIFGDYVEKGKGGRGYKSIADTGIGIRLYFDPVSIGEKGNHCHIEIPGQACECMLPDRFRDMMTYLVFGRMKEGKQQLDMFKVTRIDLAFDHEYFAPEQFYEAIQGPEIVTLAKRSSILKYQSPQALRDDGEIGTTTVSLGSNQSGRMITVYDKRGPTRVEFQLRDERANLVAMDLLLRSPAIWHEAALKHLVQFVSFKEGQEPDWWEKFIQSVQSADLVISSSRVVSLRKLIDWIIKQVAVPLSVVYDICGEEFVLDIIKQARKMDRSKYAALLEMV